MSAPVAKIRTIDTRMAPTRVIPVMRLAVSGTLLFVSMVNESGAVPCLQVLTYSVYSAIVYAVPWRWRRFTKIPSFWEHWIDLAWITSFALCSQMSPALQLGLLFPVLAAAIRAGFSSAVLVTLASAIVCAWFELTSTTPAPDGRLQVPVCAGIILILGYALARWGGFEIRLKRRLEFLAEAAKISNPRLGAEHIFDSMMRRLLKFYDADASLLVMREADSEEVTLRRLSRREAATATGPEPIPQELATLLELPPGSAAIYRSQPARRVFGRAYYREYSMTEGKGSMKSRCPSPKIAAALDAESFVSVPVVYRDLSLGRLFLTSGKRKKFEDSDMYFVLQVIEQVMPIIDNARLMDRLIVEAAAEDRKKIARDLHDGVIQPYIGIRIGLDALRRKADAGKVGSEEIDRLIEISDSGLGDLRSFVSGLRNRADHQTDLPSAVRQFARRFGDVTGISIQVDVENDFAISKSVAAEAYLIIREGLSNIRRHTQSTRARVGLACPNGELEIRIEDLENGCLTKPFLPRSIVERVEALGGRSKVEPGPSNGCSVLVQVPL
ncbi:MAG TPA: histidine kinase [Anaerolineales bacterium]|jgi:signal transduction histidine kinase